MDLRRPAALVRAHYLANWNQMLRAAESGGKLAQAIVVTIAIAVLILPALFAFRGGLALGTGLAAGDRDQLVIWNVILATLTIGFGFLGSFRFRPAFPFQRFGRLPLSPVQLLIAEIPAAVFEVFPLLGMVAVTLLSAGLAIRMPLHTPLVALLAIAGMVSMLSIIFLLSAIWSLVAGRKVLRLLLMAILLAVLLRGGLASLKYVFGDLLPPAIEMTPLSFGYRGLLALRANHAGEGLLGIAFAIAMTTLLFGAAVFIHRIRLLTESAAVSSRGGRETAIRFRNPSDGIGWLFARQLLGGREMRLELILPMIYTVTVALVASFAARVAAEGKPMPENLLETIHHVTRAPWFTIVPVLAVAFNPKIWLNQFGWDRGGIRTFLLLPIGARDLLSGKLRGIAVFTLIQTTLGVLPLLSIRTPSLREVATAIAVAGVAIVVTAAVGQVVSIRYPRPVDPDGMRGTQIPLHIGWISPVTLAPTILLLAGLYAIGNLIAPAMGVGAIVLALIGAVQFYRRILLPRLAVMLEANQERLLSM